MTTHNIKHAEHRERRTAPNSAGIVRPAGRESSS